MSLRTLSKHRTEATYANSWKSPEASSKSVKHTQYAITRFHRAVRRTQRELIALGLLDLDEWREQEAIDRDFDHWGETQPLFWDYDNDLTPSELDCLAIEHRNRTAHCWVRS